MSERPDLQAVLKAAKAREIDWLAVADFARISRAGGVSEEFRQHLAETGVEVLTPCARPDTRLVPLTDSVEVEALHWMLEVEVSALEMEELRLRRAAERERCN